MTNIAKHAWLDLPQDLSSQVCEAPLSREELDMISLEYTTFEDALPVWVNFHTVTEDTILSAIHNHKHGLEIIEFLTRQRWQISLSEDMLSGTTALKKPRLQLMQQIRFKHDNSG
jgi:hypothetical protein